MKEGLIKDTYEMIFKELQTVISLSYIIIVGIGMLFNYQKYSEFGINIFEYSDIFDFLIAPFSDFSIFLFAMASIILLFVLIKMDNYIKIKWPKIYSKLNFGLDRKSWYAVYRWVIFLASFLIYLYLAADYYGKCAKNKVLMEGNITLELSCNKTISGRMIGKTKDMIFLLKGDNISAVPLFSIIEEIKPK